MSLLSVLTLFKVVVCIYVCMYDDVFRTFASMRRELGKWLMDIAKYMTTAILLSSIFNGIEEWAWYVYALIVVAVLVTLFVGLSMVKDKEE